MTEIDRHSDPGDALWGRERRDKFLLAIIDAYPLRGASRQARLDEAKKALFGEEPATATKKEMGPDDYPALLWMAAEYNKDRCLASLPPAHPHRKDFTKERSIRQLAEGAAKMVEAHSLDAAVDRLRKKFKKNMNKYLDLELYDDDIPASIDYEVLKTLVEPMQKVDIRLQIADVGLSLSPHRISKKP